MVKFAEMAVFSSRPETSAAMGFEPMDETLIPSALSRYQQIIFPVIFSWFFFFLSHQILDYFYVGNSNKL